MASALTISQGEMLIGYIRDSVVAYVDEIEDCATNYGT
jgi:hypothetical protein